MCIRVVGILPLQRVQQPPYIPQSCGLCKWRQCGIVKLYCVSTVAIGTFFSVFTVLCIANSGNKISYNVSEMLGVLKSGR